MNWFGGGLINVLLYQGGGTVGGQGFILTESSDNIQTESADDLITDQT